MSCTPNSVGHGYATTCTAVPDAGYAVASFAGCTRVGTSDDCELTNVTAPATVSAAFVPTYPITVSPPTNGTVSCTPNPVPRGGSATCTAVPDAGFSVAGFSGCTRVSTTNDCELTNVTAPATISAAFSAVPAVLTSGTLPDATEGQSYNQTLQATGGAAPYTWSVVSGSLPAGLTLNPSTGVISGTVPKVAQVTKATGSFSFGVQVLDSSNPQLQSTVQQLTLQVGAAAPATVTPVPMLGAWAMALLGLLTAGFAALGLRRRA